MFPSLLCLSLEILLKYLKKVTISHTTFYVLKGGSSTLFNYDTTSQLGLIKVVNRVQSKQNLNMEIPQVPVRIPHNTPNVNCLLAENDGLFHGIDKMKDFQVKLHINKSITPVNQPHCRVPFHIWKRIETEVTRLEQLDNIEKGEGPNAMGVLWAKAKGS